MWDLFSLFRFQVAEITFRLWTVYLLLNLVKKNCTVFEIIFSINLQGMVLCRKPSTPLESEVFCSWSWWMKALSRSLSTDIGQHAELVLLLTQLLYLFITSLINPFYCYMLFSVCLYKPQISIITDGILVNVTENSISSFGSNSSRHCVHITRISSGKKNWSFCTKLRVKSWDRFLFSIYNFQIELFDPDMGSLEMPPHQVGVYLRLRQWSGNLHSSGV